MPKAGYVGLFFIIALCSGAPGTMSDTIAKIDQFITSEMRRQKIPGMALAAVKNGGIVVAKGYGFANLDAHVPATRHSIFQAGSIGKQFIAAATARRGSNDGPSSRPTRRRSRFSERHLLLAAALPNASLQGALTSAR
jgi:hypothetical protein